MEVLYKSTRGNGETVTASQAILKGLADDGGLFVPESLPADVRLVFRHSHIHKPDHRAEQRQGELIPVFQFPHGFPHLTRHSAHGLRSVLPASASYRIL